MYFFMPFFKKKKGALFAVGDVDVFLTPSRPSSVVIDARRGVALSSCVLIAAGFVPVLLLRWYCVPAVPADCVVRSRVQSLSSGIAALRELRCGVSVVIISLGSCFLNLCTEMYTGCPPFRDKHYRMVSRQLGVFTITFSRYN